MRDFSPETATPELVKSLQGAQVCESKSPPNFDKYQLCGMYPFTIFACMYVRSAHKVAGEEIYRSAFASLYLHLKPLISGLLGYQYFIFTWAGITLLRFISNIISSSLNLISFSFRAPIVDRLDVNGSVQKLSRYISGEDDLGLSQVTDLRLKRLLQSMMAVDPSRRPKINFVLASLYFMLP